VPGFDFSRRPRTAITGEALPELGAIVVNGRQPRDIAPNTLEFYRPALGLVMRARSGVRARVTGGVLGGVVEDAKRKRLVPILGESASEDTWTIMALPKRSMFYERPSFTGDLRIFGDLASYSPGLNTSDADILAVLDAEATAEPALPPGTI